MHSSSPSRAIWAVALLLPLLVGTVLGCAPGVADGGPVATPVTTPGGASPTPDAVSPSPTVPPGATHDGSSFEPTPDPGSEPPATARPPSNEPAPTPTWRPRPTATPQQPPTQPPPSPSQPPATPAPTEPPEGEVTIVRAYLLQDTGDGPTLVSVERRLPGRRVSVGADSIRALVAGPTPDESAAVPPLESAVPGDTLLIGLDIDDGVATIDLSREFAEGGAASLMARVAQVTYTLTQFSTIDAVLFRLDGRPVAVPTSERGMTDAPVTRDDYRSVSPSILVDAPGWGGDLRDGTIVRGVANVFEASFVLELTTSDGRLLDRQVVSASCGTGCWGTFEARVAVPDDASGAGWLVAYTHSAADGSVQELRRTLVYYGGG